MRFKLGANPDQAASQHQNIRINRYQDEYSGDCQQPTTNQVASHEDNIGPDIPASRAQFYEGKNYAIAPRVKYEWKGAKEFRPALFSVLVDL